MMRSVTLGAGLVLLSALAASAASIGLTPRPPSLTAGSATVHYLEFGGDGDLSTFGAIIDSTQGISPTGVAELSFGIGFPLADPTSGATGGFDVFDDNGLFLEGTLSQVGFTEDTIELLFTNLGGPTAGSFGPSALATIMFAAPLEADPFAALVDGTAYEAQVPISSVIPLPSPALLLLTSLGLLGFAAWRGSEKVESS